MSRRKLKGNGSGKRLPAGSMIPTPSLGTARIVWGQDDADVDHKHDGDGGVKRVLSDDAANAAQYI